MLQTENESTTEKNTVIDYIRGSEKTFEADL